MSRPTGKWWERHRKRLAWDQRVLGHVQPEMAFANTADGSPYISGDFVVRTDSGYPNRIPTRINFPTDYPAREPTAFDIADRFLPHDVSRHFFFSNEQCCLWLDVASPWRASDPNGFRNFLIQLGLFYHRQLIMNQTPGTPYPGEAWDHGGRGYLEFLEQEWAISRSALRDLFSRPRGRATCPCGSGQAFLKCHEPRVNRFIRRANTFEFGQLMGLLGVLAVGTVASG